jgi:hypothetical protein
MDPITAKLMSAAGAAADPVYVDELFSTFLYKGASPYGASITINNGINLSDEGGLVWVKGRSAANQAHGLFDTERGVLRALSSNTTGAEAVSTITSSDIYQFNNNGFNIGSNWNIDLNSPDNDYCSWTFRKAPGFFDVVTWSGDSNSGRNIAHNLGSKPGCIIIKNTSTASDWIVYHQSLGATKNLRLNKTDTAQTASWAFVDTEPTSTHFTVGNDTWINLTGETYVAYIFAHDDQSFGDAGNESSIKCGSYTGNGTSSSSINTITLGFEPQWVMIKRTSSSGDWVMLDTMRGFTVAGVDDEYLLANTNGVAGSFSQASPTPTGFQLQGNNGDTNGNAATFVYIAIRRPHKPPEAGTEVFDLRLSSTDVGGFQTSTSVLADLVINFNNPTSGSVYKYWVSRLTKSYFATTPAAEVLTSSFSTDHNTGFVRTSWWSGTAAIDYTLRRAPKFFDVVTYTGTGSTNNINHNLGVVPELQLVKSRSTADNWIVFTSKIDGSNDYLFLNNDDAADNSSQSVPSATTFTFTGSSSLVNYSGTSYISYLFATVSGVSKIGTFTGTGNDINVDCGFTAGARFVMIKRTDSSGDWLYWDTLRGIVSGNESAFPMNGQSTNGNFGVDWIDPLNAGFTVTSLYNQSEVWSGYPKTGTQPAGAEWTKAFDGNLANGVYPNTNITTTLTIDVSDRPTWSSSIRIYGVNYGGVVTINGTNVTSATSGSLGWFDLTSLLGSSGTLASFSLTNPGGNYAKINAVELDGKQLVDTGVSVTPSPVNTSGGTYIFLAIA